MILAVSSAAVQSYPRWKSHRPSLDTGLGEPQTQPGHRGASQEPVAVPADLFRKYIYKYKYRRVNNFVYSRMYPSPSDMERQYRANAPMWTRGLWVSEFCIRNKAKGSSGTERKGWRAEEGGQLPPYALLVSPAQSTQCIVFPPHRLKVFVGSTCSRWVVFWLTLYNVIRRLTHCHFLPTSQYQVRMSHKVFVTRSSLTENKLL